MVCNGCPPPRGLLFGVDEEKLCEALSKELGAAPATSTSPSEFHVRRGFVRGLEHERDVQGLDLERSDGV